jgi:trehalose transport system substrate-binding protein
MSNKIHRRQFFRAAAIGLVVALALGCAPKQHASTTDGAKAGANELTFYTALSQAEWNVLKQDVFPAFEQANGCKIRAIDVASQDIPLKLDALRQADRMDVDVIGQDNMVLAQLVQKDLMEDLTPYESTIPKETIKALIDVGRFDGKLYFLPYRPNVEITYFNESYLGKHDLKPPANWDELMHVAKTLYEREGVGRVAIKADGSAAATVHLFDFVNAAGGDPMKLNDAGSIKAFTYLRDLWPYLSPESRRADFNTMNQFLAMESVYLGQNWPFGIEVIVNQGEKKDVKAYHGWAGPVREAHTLGGEVFGVPKGAPNKELALKFISYIQSHEVQSKLVQKLAWPSMRTDAYAEVPGWQKPYFEAVKEALTHAVPRPNVPYWEDFDKAINMAFREIVIEKQDVKATLDRHAAALETARKLKAPAAKAAAK